MVEELKACLAESEDHRATVVADSLKCLDAATTACEANGWAAKVFDGKLSRSERDKLRDTLTILVTFRY